MEVRVGGRARRVWMRIRLRLELRIMSNDVLVLHYYVSFSYAARLRQCLVCHSSLM